MTIENMISATRFRKYRLKIVVLGKILGINLFNGSKLALNGQMATKGLKYEKVASRPDQ